MPPTPLLFGGNCGSSWFESLLGAHPDLSSPVYEPLYGASPELRARWSSVVTTANSGHEVVLALRDLFDVDRVDLWQARKLKLGAGLVFKVRPDELRPQDLVGPKTARLIWIRRRNLLKQALSSWKRHDLGISQFTRDGVSEPVFVDLEKLDYWLQDAASLDRRCREFFHDFEGPKFIVAYEDLLTRPTFVMSSVFRRLHLPDLPVRTGYYTKVTSDSLGGAIVNVAEFTEFCAERGLAWNDEPGSTFGVE